MQRSELRLDRLQSLRFVAAAAIVIRHIFLEVDQHGVEFPFRDAFMQVPWGAGVDVFFVISGFVITISALHKPQSAGTAGDFIVQRLIRLWPTYALFTLLMLAAMFAIPGALDHPVIDPAHTTASFLFFPWPEPGDALLYPVLGQGWTLNFEMFFYTCFAATLLAPQRYRLAILLGGGIALVTAGALFRLPLPLAFWADSIVLEFLFGVVLAVAWRRVGSASSWMFLVALIGLALTFLLSTTWPDLPRVIKAGLPSVLVVGGVVFSGPTVERLFGCPPLATLGNASYALYLSHTFTINLLLMVWLKLGLAAPWGFAALAFTASIIVSLIVYVLLEKPSMAFLKNAYRRLGTPQSERHSAPADHAPPAPPPDLVRAQ